MRASVLTKHVLKLSALISLVPIVTSLFDAGVYATIAKQSTRISADLDDSLVIDSKLFIQESILETVSFKRNKQRARSDQPLAVWRNTNAKLRIGDTLLYSTDLHDAAKCLVSSLDRREGVLRQLSINDGNRLYTLQLSSPCDYDYSKRNRKLAYIAFQGSTDVIGVERALSILLKNSIERNKVESSRVSTKGDTIELCDGSQFCIRFRLWVDMLRTDRIGCILTEPIETTKRTIPLGTVIFLVKRRGRISLMESHETFESEDPADFIVGAEIARY